MSSDRLRRFALVALLVLVPFAAACGGAEEPAPAEEAAPPAPDPEPEPAAPPEEVDETPAEPQIVGNILLSGEAFEWGDIVDETQHYTWTVRVQNDTTSTLDITVRFQFLDENDAAFKTETANLRLAPAANRTVNQDGTMTYDEALKVISFTAEVLEFNIAG